jgi:hypothetical protein
MVSFPYLLLGSRAGTAAERRRSMRRDGRTGTRRPRAEGHSAGGRTVEGRTNEGSTIQGRTVEGRRATRRGGLGRGGSLRPSSGRTTGIAVPLP